MSLLPYAIAGACASVLAPIVAGFVAIRARRDAEALQARLALVPGLEHLDTLDLQIEEKRAELARIEDRSANAQALAQQEQVLQERVAKLQAEIGSLAAKQGELERIQSELEAARRELAQLRSENAAASSAAEAVRNEAHQAATRLDELRAQMSAAQQEHANLAEQAATSRAEAMDAAASARASQALLADVEATRMRHESAVDRLTAEAEAAESERNRLLPLIEELREQREELAADRRRIVAERAALQDELEKLEQRIADLGILIEGTEESPEEPREEVTVLDDLWTRVLEDRPLATEKDEQSLVSKLQSRLRDEGLVFPDRVIHAFHTTLKVGMESPLVVLAGISGTGKSLLPQRYAEVMGMNFQLVPVQPRWDGPQDLIGFFNYLQKRFVATEFTRALVQMSRYPKDFEDFATGQHAVIPGSHRDQMLLVLLDEMNIARVEYYFSELLSRLETRRQIKPSSRSDRRRASIEIETGPEVEGSLHIFPGPNVLFVGTMNEDESTQSLADKVVDRANILRFGRPDKLAATSSSDSGLGQGASRRATPGPSPALAYDTWNGWLSRGESDGLSTDEEQQVRGWIDGLNEALSSIRKPFGHRQSKAILAYAHQYPSWVPNRARLAVADQVEQRILPKLRGTELVDAGQDAVAGVLDVVEKLGDEALRDAIEQASQSSDQMFHWEGVRRTAE